MSLDGFAGSALQVLAAEKNRDIMSMTMAREVEEKESDLHIQRIQGEPVGFCLRAPEVFRIEFMSVLRRSRNACVCESSGCRYRLSSTGNIGVWFRVLFRSFPGLCPNNSFCDFAGFAKLCPTSGW